MKLIDHANRFSTKPALVTECGQTLTFSELERQSAQLANLFNDIGLRRGDTIAILMTNRVEYFLTVWAAQRSGLYFTPVNCHLSSQEASYIIEDCGASVLIADATLEPLASYALKNNLGVTHHFSVAGGIDDFKPLVDAFQGYATVPQDYEPAGSMMLYSSGTTGVPKGIRRALPEHDYGAPVRIEPMMEEMWGFKPDSCYLSPAPLYHAAPLAWCMGAQKLGCTVIMMQKFDPDRFLALIEQYEVTHTQCVPTMFSRLLYLPEERKARYRLSSLQAVIHAAAPCPMPVKEQMIDWWGPIIYEFYSGSEWFGTTAINSQEWLAHKGSVGKSLQGDIHIVDEDGSELPNGEVGLVYFENPQLNFQYHNDPQKTQSVILGENWATYGDLGYIDDENYLYLVDRRTDLIISGGVNIYPSEIENTLLEHDAVMDVAVVGGADPEWGEQVVAVVETHDGASDDALALNLMEHCRQRIAPYKCPRAVDFRKLPRTETGKLQRRVLKAAYAKLR
ncbi:MAG: AMP-binding protein [Pseudomonadales bacterium]|nr:AMP-binding protein [Pseudomonadales bacterium]